MRVLFYRDKKATDEIQIGKVTKAGVELEKPYRIQSEWGYDQFKYQTNEFWRPMRLQEREVEHKQ